ncbi:hypothetical protein HAX54_012267, partial [Datura stramonium]|nr:hypothetical protein [Datura stramonium]
VTKPLRMVTIMGLDLELPPMINHYSIMSFDNPTATQRTLDTSLQGYPTIIKFKKKGGPPNTYANNAVFLLIISIFHSMRTHQLLHTTQVPQQH